jgi:hypothetical protein
MANVVDTNGASDLAAECKRLQKQCAELTDERDRLNAELAATQAERAADLKALYALTAKEFRFTQEEIFVQVGKEPPLEQIIADLK